MMKYKKWGFACQGNLVIPSPIFQTMQPSTHCLIKTRFLPVKLTDTLPDVIYLKIGLLLKKRKRKRGLLSRTEIRKEIAYAC